MPASPLPTERAGATLTERYVHAATRRLPAAQRDDVAEELRGGIADRLEALEHERPDLDTDARERAALTELGDPARLAAGYSGRGLYLIGPDLYPAFQRTLAQLLAVAVPAVTIAVGVVDALDGDPIGHVIGGAVWAGLTALVQICFWLTLTFVLIERSGPGHDALRDSLDVEWTPDQLPPLPTHPGRLRDTVTSLAFLAFMAALLIWQQFRSPIDGADGESVPILDPELWSLWLPLLLALMVAEAVLEIAKYRTGRWTVPLAAANTALSLAFAGILIHLSRAEELLNPAMVDAVQQDWSGFDPGLTHTIVAVTAAVIALWDIGEGWLRALSPSAGNSAAKC
ncbi:HAAS signaling domain-containing protein [Nocardioides sambongensis]|uniref:HAAS signaling domain-containing protein n=1 Tax=Nocardioides sambongensis TaxID=2589074 RepID=UPI001126184D|nr:hypothetical protein [Nocardioides sambongensis]